MSRFFQFGRALAVIGLTLMGGIAMAYDIPAIGSPAPDFELVAVSKGGKKETVRLSDFKGKKNIVLAFYPKAMTPG